jgi:hypothetical protein
MARDDTQSPRQRRWPVTSPVLLGDWLLIREGNDPKRRTWRLWLQGTGTVEPSPELIRHAGALASGRDLTSVISVDIPPVGEWTGRFLLLNPSKGDKESMVTSVANLARHVGPAMLAKHENRLLRMHVRAEERAFSLANCTMA